VVPFRPSTVKVKGSNGFTTPWSCLERKWRGEWLTNGGESTMSSHGKVHDRNGENFRFDEFTASRRGRRAPTAIGGGREPFLWLGRGGGVVEVVVTGI
jgi:hypothetical protein